MNFQLYIYHQFGIFWVYNERVLTFEPMSPVTNPDTRVKAAFLTGYRENVDLPVNFLRP